MENVTLKATPRTASGKGPARRLRAEGRIPVVAYGGDLDTKNLSIAREDLRGILTSHRGRNTIINLEVDGESGFPVMVKDYVVHPLSRLLLHADLVKIQPNKPVECEVPFHTQGKSKGEQAGGTLLVNLRSLTVRCLPATIPDEVVFDVSELEIDDVVKVSELTMPEGVEPLLPPERKVVVVMPPRVLETAEAAAGEGAEGEGAEGEAKAEGAEGDAGGDKAD